nr:hypothetical protein [Tanacetum cinerariifolium]
MQTQTSNALHNAIMEAGGKDRPPMLASGNYVQWKSRIKRYIDTKPNHELIHYCLQNRPYKYKWNDKVVLVAEGSTETTTERYMKNDKNVSQDIRDQLNAEAEAVQIILTGIDNDIYSTVDACPNACEMWKAIERLKQGESINVQDLETNLYWEFRKFTSWDDDEMSKDKKIDKIMALISLSFKKIYKPTNNNLQTSSNTNRENQDNSPRINRGTRYDNQRIEQADKRDGTDDEPDDQELEAHYMYMAQIQEVTPDAADNSGPIFDFQPLQKALVYKLKGEIEDFKNKNKSLESSNNHFKDANNELSKTNQLMFKDLKKFQAKLDRYNDVKYALKVEIDCAKVKGDLMSYKMKFEKSSNEYTKKINNLNQTISEMKKELFAHQETISIPSQEKAAQIKIYKTCEDKEIDKVIDLENKIKVLDNIVYKTGQTV